MSDLARLIDPRSIAIAGLSSDERKHGGRVLGHLRRLGYRGQVWGVNPNLPSIDGVGAYPSIEDLPEPPDVVVAAVPAAAALNVIAGSAGVGAVIVFAAGFAESGGEGVSLQEELVRAAATAGARLLGPNSGGVIRPARGLAASFLTCLDRPPGEIRSGPVAVVTQSGGIGSYLHNLAAGRGEGLAVSVSTGNEGDIKLGEAIDAISRLEEVRVVVAVIETVRDGETFIEALQATHDRGKRVVACRIGTADRGRALMASHTGAMAVPEAIFEGVFDSLGVVTAETPAEAYEVATIMARLSQPKGPRAGIITHSGGVAILLSDLAERAGLSLPTPSEELKLSIEPFLDHGVAGNPLDIGGIISGPARFGEVVDHLARSGEFDLLMAVSTAHPPAHTEHRVASLLALETDTPLIHLWMAGDQGADGLATLRDRAAAVTEEPRAAIRAMAGLARMTSEAPEPAPPITGPPQEWGLPLDEGVVTSTPNEAAEAADELGYPVVVKAEAPGLAHRTEVNGVKLDLRGRQEVKHAFKEVVEAAMAAGWLAVRARVQRYRPGLEVIIGALVDQSFGPMVSVGMGGVLTEVARDVVFSTAPVDERSARSMIDRLHSRHVLDGFRGAPPADVEELARIVSVMSRGLAGSGLREIEINPLIWDGQEWVAADWLFAHEA
jgi:acyl-CoA synthetase (NDP forming)